MKALQNFFENEVKNRGEVSKSRQSNKISLLYMYIAGSATVHSAKYFVRLASTAMYIGSICRTLSKQC